MQQSSPSSLAVSGVRFPRSPRRVPPRRVVRHLSTVSATSLLVAFLVVLSSLAPAAGAAADEIEFRDFAAREGSGIEYRRTPSPILGNQVRLERQPALNFGHIVMAPEKPRGSPGVALLDYDGDGDDDVYVTNGPGSANSLFRNLTVESGELGFRDVAGEAGVAATAQDSTGVCFGDTDNDGDVDLLVLGRMEPNRFFENQGDGTFTERSEVSGLGGGELGHTSCSMGDVDNDGLLDVVVANSFDWATRPAIFTMAYAASHPNQLFVNRGDNRFEERAAEAGLHVIDSVEPAIEEGGATLTWAIALVDYDQDGDVDVIHADDQGAMSPQEAERAHLQVFVNDGEGNFRVRTTEVGTDAYGAWMGLAFADFNCDGHLDVFATNIGDYTFHPIGIATEKGEWSSRWFLGGPDGGLADPGVGELAATPFGWSPMAVDYDNDADTDVIYLGSLATAVFTITGDNPGTVLENLGCSARFRYDADAMTVAHHRRVVEGAAAADLDLDGFADVVSVSSHDIPEEIEQKRYGLDHGSPFDEGAVYTEYMTPAEGGNFVPMGREFPDGGLVVEVSSGNGNHWAAVRLRGSVGTTPGGRVNRSGIGAVVSFTPDGLPTATRPVVGGAGYASQNSLEVIFGMGPEVKSGTVEVLWPGGVRNRLYGVRAGERLLVPEIPCSFDGKWSGVGEYRGCVVAALDDLVAAGVLDGAGKKRFLQSALGAYRKVRDRGAVDGEPGRGRPDLEGMADVRRRMLADG